MKKRIVFILAIQFILLASCKMVRKPINKDIIYEELALKYFIDSIYYSETFNLKGKTLFYDGLITGCSRCYYDPIEVYRTRKYSEAVEFKKSYLNNNAKDFYIEVPEKVKNISFGEFKKSENDNNYFLNVKHYIKSKKKILVVIDFINKKEVTNKMFIFLDLKGSLIEWEEETRMFIAPPQFH